MHLALTGVFGSVGFGSPSANLKVRPANRPVLWFFVVFGWLSGWANPLNAEV